MNMWFAKMRTGYFNYERWYGELTGAKRNKRKTVVK
jgi:hypothetical protein